MKICQPCQFVKTTAATPVRLADLPILKCKEPVTQNKALNRMMIHLQGEIDQVSDDLCKNVTHSQDVCTYILAKFVGVVSPIQI